MSESVDCLCLETTLDQPLQGAILALLADGPVHGQCLAERISQTAARRGEDRGLSDVYRSLKELEAAGLVASCWDTGGQGHVRRIFEITPQGRQCLSGRAASP